MDSRAGAVDTDTSVTSLLALCRAGDVVSMAGLVRLGYWSCVSAEVISLLVVTCFDCMDV